MEGLDVKDTEELLDLSDTAKQKATEPKNIKDYSLNVKFREKEENGMFVVEKKLGS